MGRTWKTINPAKVDSNTVTNETINKTSFEYLVIWIFWIPYAIPTPSESKLRVTANKNKLKNIIKHL